MNFPRRPRRHVAPLLTLALSASLLFAQQPKPAPKTTAAPKPSADQSVPDVTLDTLFAADSYAIYGEMRGVGQYVSSEEFKQLLGPLKLPGTVPPEITRLLDFVNAHAEILSSARLAFGAMAARDGLPDVVAAVELSSNEDAQKLEPQLREFVADYYGAQTGEEGAAATDAGAAKRSARLGASPTVAAEGAGSRAVRRRARSQSQSSRTLRAGERVEAQAVAPLFIRRAGSLVVMADKQFTFRRLRGAAGAQSLMDEPGFQAARARLSSDTLFLYFNTTRMSRSLKRQMDEYERQRQLAEAAEANAKGITVHTSTPLLFPPDDRPVPYGAGTNMNAPADQARAGANNAALTGNSNASPAPLAELSDLPPERRAELEAAIAESTANLEEHKRRADEIEALRKSQPDYEQKERQREFERHFQRLVFNDAPTGGTWAESIGVGASIQGDEIVARALFVNDAEDRTPRPVPFMPILLSGPQVSPEAAGVVPADADIFVAASLDLPQMYDYVASVFKIFDLAAGAQEKQGLFESQISAFEKDNKFRIREDLLNSLGNEIALVMPSDFLGVRRARKVPAGAGGDAANADQSKQEPRSFVASPVVVVSLSDKKALQELLPRALEAAGIKGVSEAQLIEKRGDVEVLTFTQASAAFIGNFLVMSDAPTMRWVIDAYNKGETLAGSDEYRRASGWQPRQLLGQVYVSNALFKDHFGDVYKSIDDIEDQELRNFLARLDPNPGAVTHTLTKEGNGLLHELHVPKNLLALMSASAVVAQQLAPMRRNEAMAMSALYTIASRQDAFKGKHGRFATQSELEGELKSGGLGGVLTMSEVSGYEIRFTTSGDSLSATATPTGYPKQGRRSFFIDETYMLRGADLNGKPANASTPPLNSGN
jgi:hypothetical protein